ncbi:hypothetical protein M8C21_016763 [Ambrosia artemisiifolia]|uniref:Uncharacterized protein n=1 Tax=Ambrosia artemisiifolia TaxID=4212 RepID=A0AAD5GBU2_AMBAR|nr:hypothetical protein M8C21_016763 [Ambrosia artemisiifolia]
MDLTPQVRFTLGRQSSMAPERVLRSESEDEEVDGHMVKRDELLWEAYRSMSQHKLQLGSANLPNDSSLRQPQSSPDAQKKTKISKHVAWRIGDHASHQKTVDLIKEYNSQFNEKVKAIMLDTKPLCDALGVGHLEICKIIEVHGRIDPHPSNEGGLSDGVDNLDQGDQEGNPSQAKIECVVNDQEGEAPQAKDEGVDNNMRVSESSQAKIEGIVAHDQEDEAIYAKEEGIVNNEQESEFSQSKVLVHNGDNKCA